MNIRRYQRDDLHKLFEYWRKVGADIPYFFAVSAPKWQTSLLKDKLGSERIFKSLETYFATEGGQVLGFVQYGQPNFAWDENGQKYYNPKIGIIRHLYFEKERSDVGEALLAKAGDHLASFEQNYAFYHIFGMSCNAHHGKLHSSQSHVEQLLQAHSFRIEHENAYYVLDMRCITPAGNSQLHLCSIPRSSEEKFEVHVNVEVVGTAQVKYLTRNTAYLTWIGVVERYRSQGIGREFIKLLTQFLLSKQYHYLHTDTASDNVPAQQLYKTLGFQKEGCTRSYIQV